MVLHVEDDRSTLPLSYGQPPVWAAVSYINMPESFRGTKLREQTRSDLCETLPYFKSYQSGYYGKGAMGFSFLLDGSAIEGDWLDEDIAITVA